MIPTIDDICDVYFFYICVKTFCTAKMSLKNKICLYDYCYTFRPHWTSYMSIGSFIRIYILVQDNPVQSLIYRSLPWRHNGRDRVSNHQPHDCLLSRLSLGRSKKTSKLRVTGLCAGDLPMTGEFPHKWPVTRKMFPFDDVIMMCHYLGGFCSTYEHFTRDSLWDSHLYVDREYCHTLRRCWTSYMPIASFIKTYDLDRKYKDYVYGIC